MVKRRAGYGVSVVFSALIILAIIVVANYLSNLYFTRADLTENKEFTISDPTKAILKDLEDLVTIQLFFSKELPTYVMPLRTQVEDLLEEYKAYSGGNIQVEYIDPEDDPELKQKMQFMGIPPVQLNVIQKDKTELVTVYLGLAILYENKKEVIPVIRGTENLEYQLTSGISKVTISEVKSVGLLPLSEGMSAEDFTRLKEALQKLYDVKDIDLNSPRGLEKVDTLLVIGSKELSDWEKFQIDQAIMGGANAIFLTDMIQRERGQLGATPAKSNLNALLNNYGFRVNENLVLDRSCAMAAFSSGRYMQFQLPYQFWVKVGPTGLSEDSPAVRQLSSVIFPWTSSVDVIAEEGSGAKYEAIARSSEASWLQTDKFDLSPQQKFTRTDGGSYELAVEGSGTFKSLFAGQEAPKPDDEEAARYARKEQEVIAESPPTKVVVMGGSFLINNEFLSRYPRNDLFIANLIDVMTLGKGLVGIRTRGADERRLEEVSEGGKAWIKFGNMLGIPILVAIFGLSRYFIRKKRKRAL